ncbi:MAG: type IV secretion system protein [Neisseria zoodegmatis]|uniref:type IV secretion system protein n=1 Tax=Neisseria zoodegmatis TaxID=326523 RepID=UPI0026F29518|nr:type IV secretion system protein [Neisseria zoodegmatis]MDO5069406.1 type IV secretion system protein [Neisseria zoodegmatis]
MTLSNLKKTAIAALMSAGLVTASIHPAVASGILVFDGANMAQAIQQGIQMGQQIQNQIKQLQELKSQVKALTGSRNLGEFAKNAALDQVPDEWKAVYGDIKNLDSKSLTGKDRYKQSNAADALINSYKQAAKAVQDAETRIKVINQLAQQINQTQDAKAAADLQNRISIEQSKIATNQVMLDMAMKMAEQQEKIQSVQQRNIVACQIKANSRAARKECGSI